MNPGSHLRPVPAHEGSAPTSPPPPRATTEQLVQRARAGDMSAWSRLYQDHYERIYRHVRALTGEPGLAEELGLAQLGLWFDPGGRRRGSR